MAFKELLSVTATITTIGQFLSGILTIIKIWRRGSAGDISPIPFLAGVVGCSLWMYYGLIIGDVTIMYTNIVGSLLNASYVGFFLTLSKKKMPLFRQILFAGVFITFVVMWCQSLENVQAQKSNLGMTCVVVSLLCCASPLIALKTVIESNSTQALPFPLILSMFLVCSQWWVYGLLINDFYTQVTNFLGTCIALIQLSLFVIYPSTPNIKKKLSPQVLHTPLI